MMMGASSCIRNIMIATMTISAIIPTIIDPAKTIYIDIECSMVLSNYKSTFQKEIRTHYIVRAKKIKSHRWHRLNVIGRKYASVLDFG